MTAEHALAVSKLKELGFTYQQTDHGMCWVDTADVVESAARYQWLRHHWAELATITDYYHDVHTLRTVRHVTRIDMFPDRLPVSPASVDFHLDKVRKAYP